VGRNLTEQLIPLRPINHNQNDLFGSACSVGICLYVQLLSAKSAQV